MHLNESKVMPNSSIDSDADENRVTIIPPCWTSAELSARPFFGQTRRRIVGYTALTAKPEIFRD